MADQPKQPPPAQQQQKQSPPPQQQPPPAQQQPKQGPPAQQQQQGTPPQQQQQQGAPPQQQRPNPASQQQKQGTPPQQKTAADVSGNPRFSVDELIDLALCTPEQGAVNFNILRILLKDIVKKAGIEKSPVKVNDLEAHQVENFKNYVQGSAVASPMPGVLRLGPGGVPATGNPSGSNLRGTPPGGSRQGQTPRTPKTGLPPQGSGGNGTFGGGFQMDPNMEIGDRVAKMEKHLEALYQLPANADLIEKAKQEGSMSVNDMWQIIQLNNRIAAAEAAIQKMASLIEDLAKNMGKVKVDTKGLKKDTQGLVSTNSDLMIQGQGLNDKYDQFSNVIKGIKADVDTLKKGWKKDRENLEKSLGVDLGKVPSFMKTKQEPVYETGDNSEQFERGTQTFVKADQKQPGKQQQKGQGGQQPQPRQQGQGQPQDQQAESAPPKPKKAPEKMIPPQQIAKMTAEEIAREITPEEIRTIPPEVYRDMTPEQKKAVQEIRKTAKPPQQQEVRKPPMGVSKMTKEQISELPPEQIAEKMGYEEAVNLPPEVLESMTEEQKQNVKKVVEKGPPPKRPTSRKDLRKEGQPQQQQQQQQQQKKPVPASPPMGVASMDQEELNEIPAAKIVASMPYEEAVNIPPKVLEKMTAEQQAAVKKVVNQGPPPGPKKAPQMGIANMTQDQLKGVSAQEIADKLNYEEAANIPPKVLEKMTAEQQAAVKKVVNKGPPPAQKKAPQMGIANMTQDQLKGVSAQEIADKLNYEEAANIPPQVLQKMTADQQAAVKKVVNQGPPPGPKKAPQMGIANMTQDQLKGVSAQEIADKLNYEEAANIPPKVLEKMTAEQQAAVKKVVNKGPPPAADKKKTAPQMGIVSMTQEQLKKVSAGEIAEKLNFQEAKNIPPQVLEKMTAEQQAAVQKIVESGPPPGEEDFYDDDGDSYYDDESVQQQRLQPHQQKKTSRGSRGSASQKSQRPSATADEINELSQKTPSELRKTVRPEAVVNIPREVLAQNFSPDQVKEIEKLKEEATQNVLQKAADMSPTALVSALTPEQLQNLGKDQLEQLTEEQQNAVNEARKMLDKEYTDSGFPDETYEPEYTTVEEVPDGDESAATGSGKRKSIKERGPKPMPKRVEKKHHHHKPHRRDEVGEDGETRPGKHAKIDVVQGPIPTVGEPLPPITLEEYLASLPPEEAANLAADAVQRELQKQYQQLQGMQRQLAQDIQEKMEFIYQKLLREIVAQQLTTSPYMAVGGPEQCLGPGICTGHGMPAGIAVVQFPEAQDKTMAAVGTTGDGGGEVKVCPGPPICPGKDVCPHCRAGKDGLQGLKGLDKPGEAGATAATAAPLAIGQRATDLDEALLQEMKSLMLLDLEKIRDEMRSKKMASYDEQDMFERMAAVWEALKILKHNEEAIAVKIAKQDALFKRLPTKTIEKLSKIPDDNLDAIATGNFNKPMYIPEGHGHRQSVQREAEEAFKIPMPTMVSGGAGGSGGAEKEDIQTLFNNLANVIAECTEQKDRIDQLADTARIMESGMVTKQMLLDSLSDKADKGLINTKVSYDEFGNTIDELHTQLHNLMVEGYQRNENWKKVTADLAEELAEKLDKVELAPIRAFFKSHLKTLEEKVRNLTQLIEEPDPAGTRKKLLRDYNCISCDRMVNIAGVTNGPTLPTIGPIKAGHPTASKRALELHRMRMHKKFDPNTKNLNAMERHGKQLQNKKSEPKKEPNAEQIANDIDVMHVVNRYTGGSHTAINNSSRIAAQRMSGGGKTGSGNAIEELFDNTNRHRSVGEVPPVTSTTAANGGGGRASLTGAGGGGRGSSGAIPPLNAAGSTQKVAEAAPT